MTHNEGPWHAQGAHVHDDLGRHIAVADEARARHAANARLIAAAPELLDACGRVRNFLLCSGGPLGACNAVDVLQAAITKATGEAQP